jgi:hypothetical protein
MSAAQYFLTKSNILALEHKLVVRGRVIDGDSDGRSMLQFALRS